MKTYFFTKTEIPDLDILEEGILISLMENKNYLYLRWDEADRLLKVNYDIELSESDKTILDSIAENI